MENDKKLLQFYGGRWVCFLPMVLFVVGIIVAIMGFKSGTDGALWVPGYLALAATFFLAKNKKEYTNAVIEGVANKDAILPIICWLFAGVFSRILRCSGMSDAIAGVALDLGVNTVVFTIITFLASALFASAAGTGFGTIVAGMSILYPAGCALGCNPALLAGLIVSGGAFGDNLAPVSDTTLASATSMGVDIPTCVRTRLKYSLTAGAITIVIAAVIAAFTSSTSAAATASIDYNPLALLMLLAVVVTIVVALKSSDIIIATIIGAVFAAVLGCVLGLFDFIQIDVANPARDALFTVLTPEGGDRTFGGIIYVGLNSMVQVCIMAIFLFGCISVMRAGGGDQMMLHSLTKVTDTPVKAELSLSFIDVVLNCFMGLNAPVILLVGSSLGKPLAEKHNISPYRIANLLDAQGCTLSYTVPWATALIFCTGVANSVGYPLTTIQISPFVIYCFVLFVVIIVTTLLGIGRHEGLPKEAKAKK